MNGWICPRCGRALAPDVKECPHCQPSAWVAPSVPWIYPQGTPWYPWYPPYYITCTTELVKSFATGGVNGPDASGTIS